MLPNGDAVSARPASGRQYEILRGDHRAQVTQVGATLRSYTHDGYEVIDGFPIAERATDGRGQVLAPWPNVGAERAPFGAGFHPYLTLGTAAIDDLHVTIPAAGHLDAGGPDRWRALTSTGGGPLDFTQQRRLGDTQLDDCFGDLIRGDDGRAVARLHDPHGGRSVELWVDDAYRYLMVYSSDQVGRPGRRRTAVAIEPMTCPPNALRSGTDLIELDPGQSWRGTWGITTTSPDP